MLKVNIPVVFLGALVVYTIWPWLDIEISIYTMTLLASTHGKHTWDVLYIRYRLETAGAAY